MSARHKREWKLYNELTTAQAAVIAAALACDDVNYPEPLRAAVEALKAARVSLLCLGGTE